MATPALFRASRRPDLYVCARCNFRASNVPSRTTKRWIGLKYLAKVADAEVAWEEKASRVRSGEEKSMLTILEERGLVQTFTGKRDQVDRMMTDRRVGAYVGIDPTASSLHVGHMIPFMSLFWMYVHGYHTVSLLGGSTSKIGDPTDRLTSRDKQHSSVISGNMTNMHAQLKQMWKNVESYGQKYGYKWEWAWHRELINNNAWWNSLPMLEVLQILGPGMRLGSMLARETVKNKMSKGDGMSFAEFTYPLMQAWDWWYMFHTKGIQMQIGGSDQYGNITAGIDAVKYISTHHPDPKVRDEAKAIGEPFGFTVPLLTTSSGQKFGKSAGNAIWLDKEQTSSFELYKYFLCTADADVEKYLRMFTFMPLEDIRTLVKEHMESPEKRKAQHKLASEFVELVHGTEEAQLAEGDHQLLHAAPPLRGEDNVKPLQKRPKFDIQLPRHIIYQKEIAKILFAARMTNTMSEARRLVMAAGAYVGRADNEGNITWDTLTTWDPAQTEKYFIHNDLLFLRRSKADITIVQVISNEQYVRSTHKHPGMAPLWRKGVLEAMQVKASITQEEKMDIAKLLADEESFLREQDSQAQKKDGKKKKSKAKKSVQKSTPPKHSSVGRPVQTATPTSDTEPGTVVLPVENPLPGVNYVHKRPKYFDEPGEAS